MSIIEINGLQVDYERVRALKDVTFDVKEGEFLGIIGPNGGGKTTLVKSILGQIKPSAGKVLVDSKAIIGYVPQLTTFDRRFPITVGEVILTGHLPVKLKPFHRCTEHEKTHAKSVMASLSIDGLFDRQIGQLSGGQMQKVLIARALMNHPTILLLDEPTAGVDEDSRKGIYEMLSMLNQQMTIIIVSHNTAQLMPYLDRVVYINQVAHIHENPYTRTKGLENIEGATCPIDWFIYGEQLQEQMIAPTRRSS